LLNIGFPLVDGWKSCEAGRCPAGIGGEEMKAPFRALALALALACLAVAVPAVADAGWKPVERIEHYAISGRSGIELYRSIGEKGPVIGIGRAIAYTDFKLLWSRDYRPQADGSCRLVTARPSLTITYRLPKAPDNLPAPTQQAWRTFIAGIEAHEKVHGDIIVDMVRQIEAVSVGLSAPGDPDCKKVRQALQGKLGPLSQAQRQRGRDFDRDEMRNGGNIHQLIRALVEGG
jgi:predicted secreted Zn-dependent protease